MNHETFSRPTAFSGLACIVVHHNSRDSLAGTVRAIIRQGMAAEDVIVVDNSGPCPKDPPLSEVLPVNVSLLRTENRGYGAAVNVGLDHLRQTAKNCQYVLVSTHEVQPGSGAVAALLDAMESDPDVDAAGPTIKSVRRGRSGGWISRGGELSPRLGIPRHATKLRSERSPVAVVWLDGAFVLYRYRVLDSLRLREEFFLYYEETELHLRIHHAGGVVALVPSASVEETANDIPPFLQGRNLQWLNQLHGSLLARALAVPWLLAKSTLKALLRKGRGSDTLAMLRGWLFAIRNPLRDE